MCACEAEADALRKDELAERKRTPLLLAEACNEREKLDERRGCTMDAA